MGGPFDAEQTLNANSLASQAAIALENARLHRIVEQQAVVDGLTGLANRRRCEDSLTAEIARAQRLGAPFTLVLADLDDFKAVNDRNGHVVGDDVLRGFASVLRATVRDTDLAGRWGGEEFMLLLPGHRRRRAARARRSRPRRPRRADVPGPGRGHRHGHLQLRSGPAPPRRGRAGAVRRGRPGPLSGQEGRQEPGRTRAAVRSF